MEPIEINAGTYYLRQFRADDRVDDRPALLSAFADPAVRRASQEPVTNVDDAGAFIARRAEQWHADTGCHWAIAEPTTGELLGGVGLTELVEGDSARAMIWIAAPHRRTGVATVALSTVARFGFGALDLARIDFHCPTDDAAIALARRCGFIAADEDGATTLRWQLTAT